MAKTDPKSRQKVAKNWPKTGQKLTQKVAKKSPKSRQKVAKNWPKSDPKVTNSEQILNRFWTNVYF